MVSTILKNITGGMVFGIGVIYLASTLATKDAIRPGSESGGVILGLIQVVALSLPAIAIFVQVLMEYSYREAERSGKGGGVGKFGPDDYRNFILLMGFASVLFLAIGLAAMITLLQTSDALDLSSLPVMLGIILIPFLMGMVVWQRLRYG